MTIIMFKENEWWIAQCIEYDLAAQGRTIEDAQYEFQRIFCGRILVAKELGISDPLEDVPRAPLSIQQMLTNSRLSRLAFKREEELCHDVPEAYMLPREALIREASV